MSSSYYPSWIRREFVCNQRHIVRMVVVSDFWMWPTNDISHVIEFANVYENVWRCLTFWVSWLIIMLILSRRFLFGLILSLFINTFKCSFFRFQVSTIGRTPGQVSSIMTAPSRGLQMVSNGPLIPPGAPLSFASAQPNSEFWSLLYILTLVVSSSLYMEALSLTIWQFYTRTRQSKAKYAKKVHLRNALLEVVSGVFKRELLDISWFLATVPLNSFSSLFQAHKHFTHACSFLGPFTLSTVWFSLWWWGISLLSSRFSFWPVLCTRFYDTFPHTLVKPLYKHFSLKWGHWDPSLRENVM